jgi:serine/threonine protein kinase
VPLTPDTQLGPYRIEEAIGAGGMGEVYRARDTRLDRTVAIKVLPSHLSTSGDFAKRLDREARAISSLQHPNICALFDVGHVNGVDFLVMEFLEGQTLFDRLKDGALPLDETLRIGIQITQALDAAHRSGIIHRDLKPANVMLTRSGVKLLDFGLAKATEKGPTPVVTQAGTGIASMTQRREESALTAEGTILGTFQYMAPEQLEGQEADARTDLFALGAVLYEMATGRRAFEGKSQASLIAAIMSGKPEPISTVQPMTPPAFDRVVRTCLEKDPEDRWQTARDVALQLRWIEEGGSQAGVPKPVAARRRHRERLSWGLAAVMTLAVLALGGILLTRPQPPAPRPVRFHIEIPPALGSVGSPRISPDGQYVAFTGIDTLGNSAIWLRPMNALEAYPIPGTEDSNRPFWSPDSRHLGFFSKGKLKRVPIGGGPTLTLCEFTRGADGVWGAGDRILFDGRAGDSIQVVSAGGGLAAGATFIDRSRDENGHGWPFFLPDGERFVYIAFRTGGPSEVRLGRLGSRESTFLVEADSRVELLSPGFLVYEHDGTLLAQAFDTDAGTLTGDPFPLTEGIGTGAVGLAHFSGSEDGRLVYTTGGTDANQLAWYDREGNLLETVGDPMVVDEPALSPDGRRLAVEIIDAQGDQFDIWLIDLRRGVQSRFTFDPADDYSALWSPDGKTIYFSSDRDRRALFVKNAAGTGETTKLITTDGIAIVSDISRDGTTILAQVLRGETSWDIVTLPADGDSGGITIQIATGFSEGYARFSPDGRFFAYASNESGTLDVYLSTHPAGGGKWQISRDGGIEPFWREDGKELYFLTRDRRVMAVDMSLGEEVEIGLPRELFATTAEQNINTRNHYLPTPDGQRFLVVSRPSLQRVPPITVVLNWAAELKER